jgi:hypothetical protein
LVLWFSDTTGNTNYGQLKCGRPHYNSQPYTIHANVHRDGTLHTPFPCHTSRTETVAPPVQPNGAVIALDVAREEAVDTIARRAAALAGVPYGRRPPALIFGGKRLRGDRALADYGVRAGAALALAPREADAPGGSPPTVPAPGSLAGDTSPQPRTANSEAASGGFGDCRWD